MSIIVRDLPLKTNKKEIDYNDLIMLLSQKAVLNDVYKANIQFEWVEYFSEEAEDKIMEIDSVKSLFNSI